MEIAEIARKLHHLLKALDFASGLTLHEDLVRLPNQAEIRGFVENKEFLCEIYLGRPNSTTQRKLEEENSLLRAKIQSLTLERDCALKDHEAASSTVLKVEQEKSYLSAQVLALSRAEAEWKTEQAELAAALQLSRERVWKEEACNKKLRKELEKEVAVQKELSKNLEGTQDCVQRLTHTIEGFQKELKEQKHWRAHWEDRAAQCEETIHRLENKRKEVEGTLNGKIYDMGIENRKLQGSIEGLKKDLSAALFNTAEQTRSLKDAATKAIAAAQEWEQKYRKMHEEKIVSETPPQDGKFEPFPGSTIQRDAWLMAMPSTQEEVILRWLVRQMETVQRKLKK